TAGALLSWQPTSKWRFSGGYSYGITRSLNSEFETLDLDTHTFSAGGCYTYSPRLTLGLNGSYAIMNYATNFQNNAQSYTFGPIMIFRPTQFISVNAAVVVSTMNFEQNGIVRDRSHVTGLSSLVAVQHKINRYLDHDLTV